MSRPDGEGGGGRGQLSPAWEGRVWRQASLGEEWATPTYREHFRKPAEVRVIWFPI